MKNLLILGCRGFIGEHAVKFFLEKKYHVFGCDLVENSTNAYNYQKVSVLSSDFDVFFSEQKFEICINASGSGNVSYSISHPLSDFEANTTAVIKVLDTIRKYSPLCKYLHLSSAAVYGNPCRLPIKEDDEMAPSSPYGFHKLMSEIICKEYYHLYQLPVAIIRPFSVYGNGIRKQLLWDICQKLNNVGEGITLFGTGKETRDFIHISDLVGLLMKIILNSPFKCNIYNAGSGSETAIRQIADIFEKNYPNSKSITFSGEFKKGDPLNWKADISLISKLGFTAKANLNESIINYINWYCKLNEI